MSNPAKRVEPAEMEAAAWHARLGEARVASETIEAFFAWRRKPANAEAYRRVEQAWTATGGMEKDPVLGAALEAALSRQPRARAGAGVWPSVGIGAAVAAAAAAVVIVWTGTADRGVYSTAVGEQRTVQLADGSSVRMDTGTRMRVRFNGDIRKIELEAGQAMFDVARDAARPFVVEAGEARVTAIGTVFDVQRLGPAVEVTLVSGVVDVMTGDAGAPARLAAGHKAVVVANRIRTASVDAARETNWTRGRVEFRDTPLREAVAEVNRYLTDPIVLDAPLMEAERVNGVFRTGDRDAFVAAASDSLGLRVSPDADGGVRLSAEK